MCKATKLRRTRLKKLSSRTIYPSLTPLRRKSNRKLTRTVTRLTPQSVIRRVRDPVCPRKIPAPVLDVLIHLWILIQTNCLSNRCSNFRWKAALTRKRLTQCATESTAGIRLPLTARKHWTASCRLQSAKQTLQHLFKLMDSRKWLHLNRCSRCKMAWLSSFIFRYKDNHITPQYRTNRQPLIRTSLAKWANRESIQRPDSIPSSHEMSVMNLLRKHHL